MPQSLAPTPAVAAPNAAPSEYTFHNVTITITAPSGQEAYTRLCEVLAVGTARDLEYTTGTFTKDSAPDDEQDTSVLSPFADEPYLG